MFISYVLKLDYEKTKEYIHTGKSDVNYRFPKGKSLLAHMSKIGDSKMVSILIEAGANLEYTNNENKTAYYLARFDFNTICATLLFNAGAIESFPYFTTRDAESIKRFKNYKKKQRMTVWKKFKNNIFGDIKVYELEHIIIDYLYGDTTTNKNKFIKNQTDKKWKNKNIF